MIRSKRMKWAGHAARMLEMRNGYILVGKLEGRRPLGIPDRWWERNIKKDLKERNKMWGCKLSKDRVQWRVPVVTVMNLQAPIKTGNFLTNWMTISFSRRTPFHELNESVFVSYMNWCNSYTSSKEKSKILVT